MSDEVEVPVVNESPVAVQEAPAEAKVYRPSDLKKDIEAYAQANGLKVEDVDPARFIKEQGKATPRKLFRASIRNKDIPSITVNAVDEPEAINVLLAESGIPNEGVHKLLFDVVLLED